MSREREVSHSRDTTRGHRKPRQGAKKPPNSSRGRIYTEEPEDFTVSHVSMCFVSSVTRENVSGFTSSSCIHQVFNLSLRTFFFLERRVR